MTWPAPGIHNGVSERDYHAADAISKSLLWDFAPSPWRWKNAPPKEETGAMRWGSLVDCLLLTPGAVTENFVISPYADFRSKEAREWRDTETRTVIKHEDLEEATIAALRIREHGIAGSIVAASSSQVSCMAEIGQERYKARIDLVPADSEPFYGDWLFDLKTTESLADLGRTVGNWGYHVQAAFYLDIHKFLTGEERERWGFIFQCSKAPYEVAVVELDRRDIEAGRKWYQDAVALWRRCVETGNWPSPWEDEIKVISRPHWATKGDAE